MEQVENNKFLGTEKIGKLLKTFAIPCVISLIIQALYNIVDQIFIGNSSLGEFGNTATGIIYPLTVIALAVGLWLGDGASSSMSLNQGRNNTKNTHKSVGTALVAGTVISFLIVAVCFALKSQIIRRLGASDVIFPYASEYANWIIAGFPFYVLATIINPIIRADGSPRFAMLSMAVGAVVNILLDPLFIFVFGMGMTGAALATFIAQVISFALSVAYLFKAKSFKLSLKSYLPYFSALKDLLKLGISSFLTQVAIVVTSIVNNNVLHSYMPNDESAIGLLTIAFKVFGIVISIIVGVSAGGQPIVGYNFGAKNFDRVKKVFWRIFIINLVVGAVATVFFESAPAFIFKLFGYSQVSSFGIDTFRIFLSFIIFTCLTKSTSIFFQSVGSPVKATTLTMLRDLVLLVPLAIVLPIFGGVDLFLWSAPIADIVTMAVMVVLIVPFMKKLKTQKTTEETNNATIKKSHSGIIVTISRQHGAGGRAIAKLLAKELNVPFYDKKIGLLVAKETGLASEYVNNFEDTANFSSIYLGHDVNDMTVKAQTELLKKIAEQGACVILGRCADYILRDYNLFKVFIYAPSEYKVKRITRNYGDSEEIAKINIEKSDKKRAKYYSDISGLVWGDSKNYNLCMDSSVGVVKSVELIKKCLEESVTSRLGQNK